MKSSYYVNHPHKTCICFSLTPIQKEPSKLAFSWEEKQITSRFIHTLYSKEKCLHLQVIYTAPFLRHMTISPVYMFLWATTIHPAIMYDIKLVIIRLAFVIHTLILANY